MDISRLLPRHALGLRGNFYLKPSLQKAAIECGLRIDQVGENEYRLTAASEGALENLPHSFLKGKDTTDLVSLKKLLEFLHQPVRTCMPVERERLMVHRLLRFATTGSVKIAGNDEPALQPEFLDDDDHVDIENAMKANDIWRNTSEIQSKESSQKDTCAIPGSSYNPERGTFCFQMNKQFCDTGRKCTPEQQELKNIFWSCLNKATDGRYFRRPDTIELSGTEFQNFCINIHQEIDQGAQEKAFENLLLRTEFSESVTTAIRNIRKRSQNIRITESVFQNPRNRLKNLLEATSALTSVVQSGVLQEAYARYHYSSRKDSPMAEIASQTAILMEVLKRMEQRGNVSNAEVQAVIHEFYPLLLLGRDTFESIDKTLGQNASSIFRDAAIPDPGINLKSNSKYDKIVSSLQKSLGQGAGAIRQTAQAVGGAWKGFFQDMYSFARERPVLFSAAVLLGGAALYHFNSAGNNAMAAAREIASQIPHDAIYILNDEGVLELVSYDLSKLPEDAQRESTWHLDANMLKWLISVLKGDYGNPIGFFKHYTFDIYVTKPMESLLKAVDYISRHTTEMTGHPYNPENHFITAAKDTVQPVCDVLFRGNVLQNFTHVGFWLYTAGKGWQYGLKGGAQLIKCFAPLTDLACTAAIKTFETGAGMQIVKATNIGLTPARKLGSFAQSFDRFKDSPFFQKLENIHVEKSPAPDLRKKLAGVFNIEAPAEPKKKGFLQKAWKPALTVTGGTAAAIAVGSLPHPLADTFSRVCGHAFSGGMTGLVFTNYNFWDDICGNHIGGGGLLLLKGAGAGWLVKSGITPVIQTILEKGKKLFSPVPGQGIIEGPTYTHNIT